MVALFTMWGTQNWKLHGGWRTMFPFPPSHWYIAKFKNKFHFFHSELRLYGFIIKLGDTLFIIFLEKFISIYVQCKQYARQ